MAFRQLQRLAWAAWAVAAAVACSDAAPRPPLAGRVVRHDGTAVGGAHVEVDGRQATTGPDGAFVLDGVAAGAQLTHVVVGGERSHATPIFVPEIASAGESQEITISIPNAPTGGEADLWFAGDVMFARRYQDANADGQLDDPVVLEDDDWDRRLLGSVTPLIQDADVAVVNFESTATEEGMIHPRKPYTLRSDPRTLHALAAAGVDVAGLGNNHIYDYQEEGVAGTLAAIDQAGIQHVGAAMRWADAVKPLIVETNGLRIALISATSITGREASDDSVESYDMPPYFTADPPAETGGVDKAGALRLDLDNIMEAMRLAEAAGSDLQVLIAHGGTQYSSVESVYMGTLARAAIDRGVDLVIGHHPHVVQGVEVYRGVPIIYSVGNLVFDQQFIETFPALVVEAHATRAGFSEVALRPIWIDKWAPRPLAGTAAVRLLRRVAAKSAELGAAVRVDAAAGRAVILPAQPAQVERKQITLASPGRHAPIAIADAFSAPWFVTGAGQPGVDFGRSLIASSAFDDSAVDDDPARPAGWSVVGKGKELAGGVLRLRRTSVSAEDSVARTTGRMAVIPGQRLTLTGRWMSTAGAGRAEARIAVYADRENETAPLVVAETRRDPGDWQTFDVSVVPPPGATFAQVQLVHDPPTRGDEGDVFFDDVELIAWSGVGIPPPADAAWVAIDGAAATIDLVAVP